MSENNKKGKNRFIGSMIHAVRNGESLPNIPLAIALVESEDEMEQVLGVINESSNVKENNIENDKGVPEGITVTNWNNNEEGKLINARIIIVINVNIPEPLLWEVIAHESVHAGMSACAIQSNTNPNENSLKQINDVEEFAHTISKINALVSEQVLKFKGVE